MIKCPNCGYEGKGKTFTKGSLILEILLWVLFFPLGIIYSVWRLASKYNGCPKCSNPFVIK